MVIGLLRAWISDESGRDKATREALTIVIGGVFAAAVFRLFIELDIPDLQPFARIFGGFLALMFILLVVLVFSLYLYHLNRGYPPNEVELTDEQMDEVKAEIRDVVENSDSPDS